MSTKTKTRLAQSGRGRVILHLTAVIRDHHWVWHLAGMFRELPWQHQKEIAP